MVCSGYCMYGSMTYLMITTGGGVAGFTLDPSLGEFVLTHPNVVVPDKGKIYSINEGNCLNWDAPCKAYVESCKNPASGSAYSLRYVGSMVADVHRTLLYGGIFMYPADKKNVKVGGGAGGRGWRGRALCRARAGCVVWQSMAARTSFLSLSAPRRQQQQRGWLGKMGLL